MGENRLGVDFRAIPRFLMSTAFVVKLHELYPASRREIAQIFATHLHFLGGNL
jgi:hypothetical protein